jgi:zona occludens toxin
MAIDAYVGLPGSGKSYGVVENVIVPMLKEGRQVWTNIPCNAEAMLDFCGSVPMQFHIDDIIEDPNWFFDVLPLGAVVVIDELWRLWPNGLKATQVNPKHKEFLAEHRHMVSEDGFSTQIVLVTQDLSQVSMFARSLVENTYRAVKLNMIGKSNRYRLDVYQGNVTGANPPQRLRLRQLFGKYKKPIFALYQSHTKSKSSGGGALEEKADSRGNILKGFFFKAAGVFVLVASLFIYWGVGNVSAMYSSDDDKAVKHQSTAMQSSRAVSVKRYEPKKEPPLKESEIYIKFNMGSGGSRKYIFSVSDSKSYFDIDPHGLKKLGYRVVMFNECLVRIEFGDTSRLIACKKEKESFLNLNLHAASG